MKILLVDNGSLEPAAVLALREVARRLSAREGRAVFPVSLAHSDKVPVDALGGDRRASAVGDKCKSLGGVPAQCVEPFFRAQLASGEREFVILPFFIGPSRAVMHALPKVVEKLRAQFPDLRVRIAPVLHAAGDDTLARILADRVRSVLGEIAKTERETEPQKHGQRAGVEQEACGKTEPRVRVALVDHGSPTPEVTAVRDEVAAQLAAFLGDDARVAEVAASSMECRPGPTYVFNEPLLETLLAREAWRGNAGMRSLIIVAQLFLLPGRHASLGGDIAQICARAKERSPSLQTVQTEPLATHPLIVELLAQRLAGLQNPLVP